MPKIKRMRIFAGPNGSGKSTLFEEFSKQYNAGLFINADFIEKQLSERHLVDLNEFGLTATQADFNTYLQTAVTQSLLQKSLAAGSTINIAIKENFVVSTSESTHSYEASLVASL